MVFLTTPNGMFESRCMCNRRNLSKSGTIFTHPPYLKLQTLIKRHNCFRSRLQLYRPDIPTRSKTPLPVDSQHDQYIDFTNSDFEADAAQSTVPFIDIQPVQPMKGVYCFYICLILSSKVHKPINRIVIQGCHLRDAITKLTNDILVKFLFRISGAIHTN